MSYSTTFLSFLPSESNRIIILIVSIVIATGMAVTPSHAQLYGDGSDGDYTVPFPNGVLNSDKNYSNLTIPPGAFLWLNGYTLRVNGVLLNEGTIWDPNTGPGYGSYGTGGFGYATSDGGPGGLGGSGASGVGGHGNGGDGGPGGGGGGGARDVNDGVSVQGGDGGRGGVGGRGGPEVNIYARVLNNLGEINANGLDGLDGLDGDNGEYLSYKEAIVIDRDIASGGGGGGAGGNGGDGGTLNITYETLVNAGTTTADGGNRGNGGIGGNGYNTLYGSGGQTFWYSGGNGPGFAGNGGRGAIGSGNSIDGANGQPGLNGQPGTVNLVQSVLCYVDADGDGYGDINDPGTETAPACGTGFSLNNLDCNDTDAAINPGVADIPDNGIDENCDGFDDVTCYLDVDSDGYGDSSNSTISPGSCPVGYVSNNSDCDDTNGGINPAATEIPDNGIDEDCNGFDDVTCYFDSDSDGYGDPASPFVSSTGSCPPGYVSDNSDCDDTDGSVYPGATEIPDNGIDEDCNGFDDITCFADSDNDGFGDTANTAISSTGSCPSGYLSDNTDCDDSDGSVFPGATEIPDNGIDENCDGFDDITCFADSDNDGFGNPDDFYVSSTGGCLTGFLIDNSDCDDSNGSINPGAAEIPDNGIDEDCNGIDESCCLGQTGNVDSDPFVNDILDISDLLYLVDYFFASPAGSPPVCLKEADVNGTGLLDISDLLYMVDYFFAAPTGPAPVNCN